MKKVLISGASVAGPTLAYWLHQYGFGVTVVERSDELRLGGQNIDVKGPSQKVARKMGIEKQIAQANTCEVGVQWVDKNNKVKAAFPKGDKNGLTSELEILRGDLVTILYNHTKANADYQFGKYIKAISEHDKGIEVTFSNGECAMYDLVIAADGVRSTTRELVFGDEPELKYLGLYTRYFTIPKGPTDTNWARWYTADKSRMILVRPDNRGTTRVSLNFLSPDKDYSRLSQDEQKKWLVKVFDDAGWEAPRILKEMLKSGDVFLDTVTQVRAPRWCKGRFAMVGDAAYCPTPITGEGTTLAMVGAYVLAGELYLHDDYETAFKAYEKKMRPYVQSVQRLPPGVPGLVYPSSKLGVAILNKVVGLVTSKTFRKISTLFSGSKKSGKDAFELPEYGQRTV